MIRKIVVFTVAVSFLLVGCQKNKKKEVTDETLRNDEFVTSFIKNKDGKTLEVLFNNTKGTVTVYFDGDTVEMKQDTVASGLKYSNDQYEYAEWQGEVVLRKGPEIIFAHKDDIVSSSVKNKAGETLDMTFNNTKGTAVMEFKGERIEMNQDTVASGVKFSNKDYVFTDWKGQITLKKGDQVVFEYKGK